MVGLWSTGMVVSGLGGRRLITLSDGPQEEFRTEANQVSEHAQPPRIVYLARHDGRIADLRCAAHQGHEWADSELCKV